MEAIDAAEELLVCTVSCWELSMLAQRGRIALDRAVGRWVTTAIARERVSPLPLSTEAALEAADLPRRGFPGDPADRFIYASARLAGATLITRDEALRSFDRNLTVW